MIVIINKSIKLEIERENGDECFLIRKKSFKGQLFVMFSLEAPGINRSGTHD